MDNQHSETSFGAVSGGINAVLMLDHSGRAGNSFVLTVFDQHPEVLACPLMHYTYSYILDRFGDAVDLPVAEVREYWTEQYYFRLFYQEMNAERAALVKKVGGDPEAPVDRDRVRAVFDAGLSGRNTITRRDLAVLTFLAYAAGTGRDIGAIRCLLFSDSVSLRSEAALSGFSGRIADRFLEDFPEGHILHLVRDPRAGFCSTRHQFINALGNMYGIRPGNGCERFRRLCRGDLDWDSVFVFGFWLLYFRQTFLTVQRIRERHAGRVITLRNEDLNLDFLPTLRSLCDRLGVDMLPAWHDAGYGPTMIGRPWHGTGAYNSRYQTNRYGLLPNDPDRVAERTTGPNAYVTQRWRTRMGRNEILLAEWFLEEELTAFGYPFLEYVDGRRGRASLLAGLWRPLMGELPNPRWIAQGRHGGWAEILNRLFFTAVFPPFFVAARLMFWRLALRYREAGR